MSKDIHSTLEEAIRYVGKEIDAIEIAGTPNELYEPINYIMHLGGKRLRPVLVCLACELFCGDMTKAMSAAKGIEVFHNFSLIHDDIMDAATLRRGQTTVHEKWNQNIAILAGDTMLPKAYDYVINANYPELQKLLQIFNKAAIEVCEGQQLDMNFEEMDDVSIDEYVNMIRLKTSVLLGAALKIGAVIGGAPEDDAQLLYEFGVNMGIGFQLMDDYLDAFGDPSKFGKRVGGDILSNKKTFLFITALKNDTTGAMQGWLEKEDFNEEEKISAVKELFQRTGADQRCIDEMNSYYDKGLEKLDQVNIPQERKDTLREFSNYLRNRMT